jgi:hypothetical protein
MKPIIDATDSGCPASASVVALVEHREDEDERYQRQDADDQGGFLLRPEGPVQLHREA